MKTREVSHGTSIMRSVVTWLKARATGISYGPKRKRPCVADPRINVQTIGEYLRHGYFGLNGPFGLSSPALDALWGVPGHLKPRAMAALEDAERRTGTRPDELQAFYNDLEDLVFDLNQVYIGLCEKGYHALLQKHFAERPRRPGASDGPAAIP